MNVEILNVIIFKENNISSYHIGAKNNNFNIEEIVGQNTKENKNKHYFDGSIQDGKKENNEKDDKEDIIILDQKRKHIVAWNINLNKNNNDTKERDDNTSLILILENKWLNLYQKNNDNTKINHIKNINKKKQFQY